MARKPIVRQLGEVCGGRWRAVRDGFGWRWEDDAGHSVRVYAQLNNAWDGDDSYTCVYIDDQGHTVGSQGMICNAPPWATKEKT